MGRLLSSFCFLFVAQLLFSTTVEAYLVNEWADIIESEEAKKLRTKTNPPSPVWLETYSGMEFIWINGGCYKMGSAPREDGRDSDETPVHDVCVSGFWIGKREVTQGEWRTIMHSNPSQFKKGDQYPVERVSFGEAAQLVDRLNKQHDDQAQFRLPTEAEWEYICRGGGLRTTFPGTKHVEQLGWYQDNSSGSTQSTASKDPSHLGLYDLSGNVWEWVQDNYDQNAYASHAANNPVMDNKGVFRVIRGGSWQEGPDTLRCTNRGFARADTKRSDIGIRLAVMVTPHEKKKEPVADINVLPF